MKLREPITVKAIAELINAEIIGNEDFLITGLNEVHKVIEGDLMFVDVPKYYKKALNSAASVVIINKKVANSKGKILLLSDNPYQAYNALAKRFKDYPTISEATKAEAIIGENTIIEPNVNIGKNVVIGNNSFIHANVTIYDDTIIGDNVIIHAGAVIGSDAFYYKKDNGKFDKWHPVGRVVIENEVEIGPNTTIAKGVSGDTIIGEGTKIDSLCQIGHGVVIGKHCLIAAQVGIAGKAIIGDGSTLLGQAGLAHGITLGAKTLLSAQSGVSKSLEGGQWYFGSPAVKGRVKHRELASLRQLPELMKELRALLKERKG